MKPRKWVLFIAAAALLLALAATWGTRALERRLGLEQVVLERLRPAFGGTVDIAHVRLGFLSVYLEGVRASLPLNALTIDIHDIRVGFSLRRLLFTGFAFDRSISSVALVNPTLTVRVSAIELAPADSATQTDSVATPPIDITATRLPLSQLRIVKGTVHIEGAGGNTFAFGEALDGTLAEKTDGLEFELHGRLGSLRRNLALTGVVTRDDSPSRLSLRLDNAGVMTPMTIGAITITGGRADGVCEFTLKGHAAPDAFQSSGWVTIRQGSATFAGVRDPVSGLALGLSLDGTMWTIDSLRALWNGVRVHGAGAWDIAGRDSSLVQLSIEGYDVERVFHDLPEPIARNVFGQGWLEASLCPDTLPDHVRVTARGGGLSLLGLPLTEAGAALSLGRSDITIDSLLLVTTAARVALRGGARLDDSLRTWHVAFDSHFDSLPTLSWFHGALVAQGQIRSDSAGQQVDITLKSRDPRIAGLAIGPQALQVGWEGDGLTFATRTGRDAAVWARGRLDRPFSEAPRVTLDAKVGHGILGPLLARLGLPDSASGTYAATLRLEGPLDGWRASGQIDMKSQLLDGALALRLGPDSLTGALAWSVDARNLRSGTRPIDLRAAGRYYADSLLIDSAAALGSVRARGSIGLGTMGALDVRIDYDSLDVALVADVATGGESPLDSGVVIGATRIGGFRDNIASSSELHLRGLAAGEFKPLNADALVMTAAGQVTVLPMVVRKERAVVLSLDTLRLGSRLQLSGEFDSIDIASFLGPGILEDMPVSGTISGKFWSSDSGDGIPVRLSAVSRMIKLGDFVVDSITLTGTADASGVRIDQLGAREGKRLRLSASASIPWNFLGSEVTDSDTLRTDVRVSGDIIASIERNVDSPVGGTGEGTITFGAMGTSQGWEVATFAASIPSGTLSLKPYVPAGISNLSLQMRTDDSSRVHALIQGTIGRMPVKFRSTHTIPRGYRSFQFGPLDFGIILVETPKGGVSVHLPGFHEKGEIVDVEFGALPGFPAFALSGPLERFKISGVWYVRNGEFTYPLFDSHELTGDWDPIPYVDWEIDLVPASRNVMYYWDLTGKKRKIIRFVEAYVDPTSRLQVRGRELDNNFRLLGQLRSYKGSAFFGKTFDRRFEIGLDFAPEPLPRGGFDNMPIMWGSAEAFSDTSRQQRIKLTLQLIDPATGGISERGRIRMIPKAQAQRHSTVGGGDADSVTNFNLHLSSDLEQIAGAAEREYYMEAGLRFTTIEGAGEFVSSMGEQYLHRYLLQRFERKLARSLGLDVITLETSIASNYFNRFYNREFSELNDQWNMLALAHIGITVGRYFFNDNLFLKARGELIPIEELLVPEYSVGLEFQPMRYLFFDFNYGFHRGETEIEGDPRVNLQLRVPLTRLRKNLNF